MSDSVQTNDKHVKSVYVSEPFRVALTSLERKKRQAVDLGLEHLEVGFGCKTNLSLASVALRARKLPNMKFKIWRDGDETYYARTA